MNITLDEAEEVWLARKATDKKPATEMTKKPLGESLLSVCSVQTNDVTGRLLLKGENVTAIAPPVY